MNVVMSHPILTIFDQDNDRLFLPLSSYRVKLFLSAGKEGSKSQKRGVPVFLFAVRATQPPGHERIEKSARAKCTRPGLCGGCRGGAEASEEKESTFGLILGFVDEKAKATQRPQRHQSALCLSFHSDTTRQTDAVLLTPHPDGHGRMSRDDRNMHHSRLSPIVTFSLFRVPCLESVLLASMLAGRTGSNRRVRCPPLSVQDRLHPGAIDIDPWGGRGHLDRRSVCRERRVEVSYFVAGWSVATTTTKCLKSPQPAAATVSALVRGVDDVLVGRVSGLADEKSPSRNQS